MTLFTRLPITVAGSLPVIPYGDIEYHNYESNSYDHWVFDKAGSGNLTGRVHGRALTPQAAAPAHSNNYLSLQTLKGNALLSDKPDAREQTICFVYQPIASPGLIVLAGARGDIDTSGSFLFTSNSNLYSNQTPTLQSGPVAESAGWAFVAYSESALLGNTSVVLLRGGLAAVTQAGGLLKTTGGPTVALGNRAYTNAINSSMNFAEFILYDKALTAGELADVYARSKVRMADRGLTLA